MRNLSVAVVLAAATLSVPALAQQDGGARRGGSMQDMSRQQAQQRADTMFQMLDTNKDGVVTKAEAAQAMAQAQAARGSNGGGGGGRSQRMLDQAFGNASSLSLAQFQAQSLARFDAEDLDHNGTVTAAERQQARGSMRGGQ